VDLKYELEHLIILTASRCLLGREVREKLFDDVSALFHDLDNGMQPVSVLFPYLPIPAHRKRDRSRARLAGIFASIIQSRKASGQPPEQDMLQSFIDSRLIFEGSFFAFENVKCLLLLRLCEPLSAEE
jgi:sterol 14alpha-demethylase